MVKNWVAQTAKNLPAMLESWVRSLGWEDSLEKGMATHSSILACRIPWTIESMGSQKLDMTEGLSLHFNKKVIYLFIYFKVYFFSSKKKSL